MLVPDWENDVVHRIALDGTYEGEFLGPSSVEPQSVAPGLWESPRSLSFSRTSGHVLDG